MANFFDSIYDTFSQTDTKNMEKIAEQIGGQFKSAGAIKGQQISVEYRGLKIIYDIVTISKGNNVDTRIKVEFKSSANYHIVMNTKMWLNFYINIYGWKAAAELRKYKKIFLNKEAASKLSIRGTDEELTSNIFDEKVLGDLKYSDIHTFQIHCNGESGKLYSMMSGGIEHIDSFLKVHKMICYLIDNMDAQKIIDISL